ncbi:MAG TPA: hypothetical protein VN317_07060, partial [Candidatus Methanoperedens sp.]|nr:hypothetical protein [Candidatus Methanoperedens sp.]
PVIELREEIPRIDVQREMELALEQELVPASEHPGAAEPVATATAGTETAATESAASESSVAESAAAETASGEEIGWEEESPWQAAPADGEETAAPLLAPEEAATEELVWEERPQEAAPPEEERALRPTPAEVFSLEEEIPSVDLAGEIAPEAVVEEEAAGREDTDADLEVGPAPAEAAPAPAPQPAAGRGVFDTETLASIYINQGFYGRAAAIYERLASGSPDDAALRRRLDEVRALERAQGERAGEAAPGEGAEGAAAGHRDRAETIRRLEALLEAFRGGRPR